MPRETLFLTLEIPRANREAKFAVFKGAIGCVNSRMIGRMFERPESDPEPSFVACAAETLVLARLNYVSLAGNWS